MKSKGLYSSSKKKQVGKTLKYHGQNSTTIPLHCSNPILPCILQSSLHNPGCPNITFPQGWAHATCCHPSPAPSTQACGQAEKVWAGLALQPFLSAELPSKSRSSPSHQVSENTWGFLAFETDIATLGYTWPMSPKLLVMCRQTKSVRLWNGGEKAPTDRENRINLLLENCMTVLTRWEYIREIGKNITIINSTS